MLTDDEMRERMIHGWRAGIPETICGNGSLREYSQASRDAIPQWVEKYDVRSICDAGAGDLWFVKGIRWQRALTYQACDLFVRARSLTALDITAQDLAACDLILCRMVLNHLDAPRIAMALERFRRSGKYLAATQFNGDDLPKRSPQFTRLDLRAQLGEPLERVQDGAEEIGALALWRL
jgi:hypothetical protein